MKRTYIIIKLQDIVVSTFSLGCCPNTAEGAPRGYQEEEAKDWSLSGMTHTIDPHLTPLSSRHKLLSFG